MTTAGSKPTNIVKPVYHVAWLASRLRMRVVEPLAPIADAPGSRTGGVAPAQPPRVTVVVRPSSSELPPGTTLRVELTAAIRASELRADITAEQEAVHARVWLDGERRLERGFNAPRRNDLDLLAESIEAGGRDPVAVEALTMAAELAGEVTG